ncbi:MAG TPA: hypothetical protein VG476_05185 [Acidimicrobiales bacterium]|nr:hypothetical protein [Acidimicrobiales bacterium]
MSACLGDGELDVSERLVEDTQIPERLSGEVAEEVGAGSVTPESQR